MLKTNSHAQETPSPPRPDVRHLRRRHRSSFGHCQRQLSTQTPQPHHAPLPALRAEILRIAEGAPATAAQISQLNFRLGHVFAEAALAALRQFRISPKRVALIGSHGQTIFHQGRPVPFLGHSHRLHPANRRARHHRRPHRHHHHRRLPSRGHRRRRPGRSSRSLRRLSPLPPPQTRPRLPQSRRHQQYGTTTN